MIAIRSLSKARSGVPVLSDVSLTVAEGGVTALVGPSGGGTSTLLRCLNGLDGFESGEVTIAGHRLLAGSHSPDVLEALRQDVGMVFQQFNLFPHMTAIENVSLSPRVVKRLPAGEARSQAMRLLERVGLGSFADARPATLSGGQQQRVAIARALAMKPRVMLFDEPTSALDPAMAAEVLDVILDLARAGQTMMIVTHDHLFARRAAANVVELVGGRVTAVSKKTPPGTGVPGGAH